MRNFVGWLSIILLGIILGTLVAFTIIGGVDVYRSHHSNTTISASSTRPVVHTWTKADSKAYAHDALEAFTAKQYSCLNKLWSKESAWNHKAFNPVKVMGKNAGGIPQLLGLSPLTPPTIQIDRGLKYILWRFVVPCNAWSFWKKHGWY